MAEPSFSSLGEQELETIAEKYLTQLKKRMGDSGITLELPIGLAGFLSAQCKPREGARNLRRLIQSQVEGPLADQLLMAGKKPESIRGILEEKEVIFQI